VGHVRLAEEREHRVDQALDGVHRTAVGSASGRAGVVGAEELERGVDEVQLHRIWRIAVGA
jgi:hypothetical protein